MKTMTKRIASMALAVMMAVVMLASALPTKAFAAATGDLTITSTSAEFKGKTVMAWKMFDATVGAKGAVGYQLAKEWEPFFTSTNLTDFQGDGLTGAVLSQKAYEYVSTLGDTDAEKVVAFAKKAAAWAKDTKNNVTAPSTAVAVANQDSTKYEAKFDSLSYGYYVVSPQDGSTGNNKRGTTAMLVNVKEAATEAQLKSEYPTVDKTVDDSDRSEGSDAQIGDTLKFTLTSKVPDLNEYEYFNFRFVDTLSKGLTLDKSSIVVKIKDKTLTLSNDNLATGQYTVGTEEVADPQGATKLTITLKDLVKLAKGGGFTDITAGDSITVTYSATLNKDAAVGTDSNGDNTNSAKVEWGTKNETDYDGSSNEDKTHTYTFDFKIKKTDDAQPTANPLADAEFQIKKNGEDAPMKLVVVSEGSDTAPRIVRLAISPDDDTAAKTEVATPKSGLITFQGFDAGTYKLVETKAPDGYNKLKDEIAVVITPTYKQDDGTLQSYEVTFDAQKPTDGIFVIVNKKGIELPETGGMGTILFTLVGAAAIGYGIYRKRTAKTVA